MPGNRHTNRQSYGGRVLSIQNAGLTKGQRKWLKRNSPPSRVAPMLPDANRFGWGLIVALIIWCLCLSGIVTGLTLWT